MYMVRAWIISKSINNPLARVASQEIVITRGGWDRTLVNPVVKRRGDDFWAALYVAEIVLDALQGDPRGYWGRKERECWFTAGVTPVRPSGIPIGHSKQLTVCWSPPSIQGRLCHVLTLPAPLTTLAQSPGGLPSTKWCLANIFWMSNSHVLTSDSQVGLLSEQPLHCAGESGRERPFPGISELMTLR